VPPVPSSPRTVGECTAPPPEPTLAKPAPVTGDQIRRFLTWSLEADDLLLADHATKIEPGPLALATDHARLTLHFEYPPDRAAIARTLTVSGAGFACHWAPGWDLVLEINGLAPGATATIAGIPVWERASGLDSHKLILHWEDRVTVKVEGANGPTPIAGSRQPAALAFGDTALTLRFDRPMDRAGVEKQLSRAAVKLLSGYNDQEPQVTANFRQPLPLTFTWESDTALRAVPTGLGRFRFPLGGLPAQDGTTTLNAELEAWRPDSSLGLLAAEPGAQALKGGYWPQFLFLRTWYLTKVALDGRAMLLVNPMETGFAPAYQLWLWTGDRIVRLPDTFYAGETFITGLLPDRKGAIVADSTKVYRYGPDGSRQVIWLSDRLIHGMGLAAGGDRLALFIHGEGDEIRLTVIDPLAPDPAATAVAYGVVDHEELKPSQTEVSRHRRIQAEWSPDGSEIAWGGGIWLENGMLWAPFSYHFRLKDRTPSGPTQGLEFGGFSPDGKLQLYTTGYRAVKDQPGLSTVIRTNAGETVATLEGGGWRWGTPDLLWRSDPFQWLRLGSGTVQNGPPQSIPLGWAEGRFLVIPRDDQ
jgi:hypothetical protein